MRLGYLIVAATVLAAPLGACGGHDSDEDRVVEAVVELQDALKAGKLSAVCSLMTERPMRQVGSIGHGRKPTTCERDLAEMLDSSAPTLSGDEPPSLREARRPVASGVQIDPAGDTAIVTMTLAGDGFTVRMRQDDGKWKLDDFFGAQGPTPKAFQ